MQVPAEIETEGAFCLGFTALNTFCAAAKADSLAIDADKAQAVVKAGKSRITIQPLDPRDFPQSLAAEGDMATIDGPTFCTALKFAAAAASTEETKFYLNGAYVQTGNAGLDMWGTDGHSMHHVAMPDVPAFGPGGIVPSDAVPIICSLGEKAAEFAVMVSDRGWHAKAGPVRAWGKVIDGTFPDARRLLSGFEKNGWGEIAAIAKDELSAALAVAACGADTTSGNARSLIIKSQDGEPIVIRGARGASGVIHAGRAETETRAKSAAACAVSSVLFARALTAIPAADVVVSLVGGGESILRIRPSQESATMQAEAIVMGMRVSAQEMADA